MKILSWNELFGPITGRQNKRLNLNNAKWHTCTEDTMFDGFRYAKGSRYKYWEGRDFGFVCFAPDSLTPDGSKPGRFLHKY